MMPSACRAVLWACVLAAGCSPKDVDLVPSPALDEPGAGTGGPSGAPLELSIVADGAPDDARDFFPDDRSGDETSDREGPRVVYPSHETMLPPNLDRLTVQWVADDALDLFELRFDSRLAHVRYYTDQRALMPDADTFRRIAASHAGATIQVSVRGVRRSERGRVLRSAEASLLIARREVPGAIYYWSTGSSGVMRAHVAAASATKFYTDPSAADADKCAGCHTVSRDGRRLAVGYDGERLREVLIPTREQILPLATAAPEPAPMEPMAEPMEPMEPMAEPIEPEPIEPMPKPDEGVAFGWGTFSPDGTRLLYAHKGELRLLDADTGEMLAHVMLPGDVRATHPDWAPDGRFIALSYGSSDRGDKNKEVIGSSIARLEVLADGTFGTPEILAQSVDPEDTLCFPSYSPDSRLIAFARMRGKSKDNATAELFLVDAEGGEPVPLPRLNQRVRDENGVRDVGNTMPTWAPSEADADVLFLAFSSHRDYGELLRGVERDQLWAAAVDPSRLGYDMADASYAAFWMPFQDLADNNHRAFWARAVEDECPATLELCDGLDEDCDGRVDEGCCTPAPEVCGDGEDNDCDGLPDERCGCQETDACDNGLDDDCDQSVDEDCVF
jgi:hypothetical protein